MIGLGPVYLTNVSSKNLKNEDVAIEFVSGIFSDILNKMQESELFKNELFPESSAQSWYKEMINSEYSRTIVKQSFQPLIKELTEKFNKPSR